MNRKTAPVFLIFLVMGFGDLIGPLVSLVKQKLSLTQFEASFIAFAGFIMFGTLSIPTGYFQHRFGKRVTVIVGLLLVLAGLLTPALGLTRYAVFLLAVLLLGAGVTVLQTAGSPLLHTLSAAGAYARNLTFGQFIKGIGTLSSPLIPLIAIRYADNRWEIVFVIFAVFTLLALIIFVSAIRETIPESSSQKSASLSAIFALLGNAGVAKMVLAIFLYVGAEVCMSATLPGILKVQSGYQASDIGMAGVGLFFLTIMAGRFGGTLVLRWLRPAKFYLISCVLSLTGLILIAFGQGLLGFVAACLVGLGFSNIFPLVFSLAIDAQPEKANELSALMVTAIAGGAIVPPVMGYVADHAGVQLSLIVPAGCVAYLTAIAVNSLRSEKNAA